MSEATPAPAVVPAEAEPKLAAAAAPRSLFQRLFGISFWGGLKLLGLCIFVGFFVRAANFGSSDSATIPGTLAAVLRQAFQAANWAVQSFWQPALAGGLVVIPLWVLWRLVSLPFRK